MNNLIIILYLNLNFFMIFLVEMSERRIAGPKTMHPFKTVNVYDFA